MTMKRILAAAFLSVMALQAGAQGWTDALNFSENDYLGTAGPFRGHGQRDDRRRR